VLRELEEAGAHVPVVVGGIIPPADEAALLDAGVSRVYTPKDFEVSRIMGDIVELVAERHGVAATVS
jgi:(2R)-ethylmalonyl-CoA mutase